MFLGSIFFAASPLFPIVSNAFDNAIPEKLKYKDRPKQRGPTPPDLGIKERGDLGEGLKTCAPGANCFTTSGDTEFDRFYLLSPWVPKKGEEDKAIEIIASIVSEYPPGQNKIDGGGFSIIKSTPSYFYAQFESLKNTYIDDLEFAKAKDGTGRVLVRSSSRLGYLDYGVNALRLNWISERLRERGWTAEELTPTTHPDYFSQNGRK